MQPEYRAERQEKRRLWLEEVGPFTAECLETIRSFIPPTIFSSSLDELVQYEGMHKPLAKRIITKQCLWLVRMTPEMIAKIHEGDLIGRYSSEGQKLDIIELGAIYAALPSKFEADAFSRKQQWLERVEGNLKALMELKKAGTLPSDRSRNAVYKNQLPMFGDRDSLHDLESNSASSSHHPAAARESITGRSSFSNLVSSFFSRFSTHAMEEDLVVGGSGTTSTKSKIRAFELEAKRGSKPSTTSSLSIPNPKPIKLDSSFAASLASKIAGAAGVVGGGGEGQQRRRERNEDFDASGDITHNPMSTVTHQ